MDIDKDPNDPLHFFSIYTHIQVALVNDLGNQLCSTLDLAFASEEIDRMLLYRVYGLFWLWVLGSYEIVRTMTQAQTCFKPELLQKLRDFKKHVTPLRMIFAKQEYAGENRPVGDEAMLSEIDISRKDLGYEVKSRTYMIRDTVMRFTRLTNEIKLEDILSDHRQSYSSVSDI